MPSRRWRRRGTLRDSWRGTSHFPVLRKSGWPRRLTLAKRWVARRLQKVGGPTSSKGGWPDVFKRWVARRLQKVGGPTSSKGGWPDVFKRWVARRLPRVSECAHGERRRDSAEGTETGRGDECLSPHLQANDGSTSFAPRPQVLTPDPGYREDRRVSPRRDGWVVG